METLGIIGALMGALCGPSYAIAWISRQVALREFLSYLAYRCYDRLDTGTDVFWEDLQVLYDLECQRLLGGPWKMTFAEGHGLVGYLDAICQINPPRSSQWKRRLDHLKRSLPNETIGVMGENLFANVAAFAMLMWMSASLMMLRGTAQFSFGAGVGITITGSVLAILTSLIAYMQVQALVLFRQHRQNAEQQLKGARSKA